MQRRNRMAKWLTLMLAVVMTVTLMGGCTTNGGGTTTTAQVTTTQGTSLQETTTAAATESFFPLKDKISVRIFWASPPTEKTEVTKELEKRTNVELVVEKFDATKLELVLSSGDVPDIIGCWGDTGSIQIINRYGRDGMLVDFMKYLDKMPNFNKQTERLPILIDHYKTKEGNLFMSKNASLWDNKIRMQFDLSYLYRGKYLDEFNLKAPATFDEIFNDSKIIHDKYPDVYGITGSDGAWPIDWTCEAYHSSSWDSRVIFYSQDENKYKFAPADTNFKDAMKWLRKMYAANLLDPEFFTMGGEEYRKKVQDGKVFMDVWYPSDWYSMGITDLVMAPPPITDTGLQARIENSGTVQWPTLALSAKSKYVDDLIQYVDYMKSDEVTELLNWGIEGTTFKKNADGTKEFIMTPEELTKYGLADLVYRAMTPFDYYASYGQLGKVQLGFFEQMYSFAKENPDRLYLFPPEIITDKAFDEEKNLVMTSLSTFVNESIVKFITGKLNIDTDWDKFVTDCKAAGDYDKIINQMNTYIKDQYGSDFKLTVDYYGGLEAK